MSTCDKCNHLSLFIKISSAITPGEDLKELLPVLMDLLGEDMSINRGMVTILNRKTSEIIATSSYGMSEDEKARGIYQLGEGITGKVVETGEPIVIENTDNDPLFLNRTGSSRKGENNGFLCVPVKTTNEVIGSLSIDKSYSIKEAIQDDLKILTIISTMISRAVRLHQALHEEQQLVWENEELQARLARGLKNPGNIIGNSRIMRNMYDLIDKISGASSTVLITGESGSGKELVARAIHFSGNRADRPYIPFNCAALPESLLESELFGHTKGAFTGAFAEKDGKFQAADGGTIFLDEIGEMSMTAQSKLLRVLQEKEVEKVGTNSPVKIDVRVVAATNRDLMELVDEGLFRLDLYYRLNVFPINVPPLRMRKTDIPLLVDTFIEKYSSITNNKVKRISTPAIDMLMSYHWPGNVRELENCIERAVILAEDEVIHSYHLPPSLQTIGKVPSGETGRLQSQLDILEYELVIEELKRTAGNIKEAAANLGITYRQFGLRLDKYKINIDKYKKQGVYNG
ncbi:sigma-54 interaction domain-containing protein [Spirochaeta isovalerica]|uniref:Nif-specific regulatory protein n=1 Tax=Spirochaeta isovalerica TaxID=150 RepID=A0A841RCM6_9SPIO|nr:sigma 54-interacting transcriptional regulator [Spirochaeta isovalerica]MBB6480152.1 Nif-specific regulatory protein [Spirochaeta isovalerica]